MSTNAVTSQVNWFAFARQAEARKIRSDEDIRLSQEIICVEWGAAFL
jgi:hypothetical protein